MPARRPALTKTKRHRPGLLLLTLLLTTGVLAIATGSRLLSQQFELVTDFAPDSAQSGLFLDNLVFSEGAVVNGYTLFSGCTEVFGCEVWRTDGTALGTEMLVDTDPGPRHGFLYGRLAVLDGVAYFTAGFPAQLWRSDGTPEGTEVIVERVTAFGGDVTVANGALWFVGYDEDHGDEPWTSDGTAAGSRRVADIEPGAGDSSPGWFTAVGGLVCFSATTALNGAELWASDGTEAGTFQVADLRPGSDGSFPRGLHALGNLLLFSASDGTNGIELWRTDGTGAGTVRLEIWAGPESANPTILGALPGGLALLVAEDGVDGRELWRTNGTIVQQVVDLYPGAESGIPLGFDWIRTEDAVYFTGIANNQTGEELWRSNGTAGGTMQVADIDSTTASSEPRNFVPLGDWLYFSAEAPDRELWRTNIVTGVTEQVADLDGGAASSLSRTMTGFLGPSGELLFPGEVDPLGWELWRTDGTAGGTQRLTDVIDPASSEPQNLTPWQEGGLVFQPNDGDDLGAVVAVDGDDFDTSVESFTFPETPVATTLQVWQNELFVAERSFGESLTRLWKWNGSTEALLAEDTVATTFGLNPTPSGVAFIKSGELSLTDGAVVGDFSLLELASPPEGSIERFWYSEDSIWYTVGEELWSTDLVNDTSALLVDLSADPDVAFHELLGDVGGTFYFSLRRTVGGVFEETLICAVDATPQGYSTVHSFDAAAGFVTNDLFDLNGQALLLSNVDPDAWQLHVLAGADTPAALVTEGFGRPIETLAVANRLAFRTGEGLWSSDGTAVGTALIAGTQDFELEAVLPGWALVSGPQVGRGFELALVSLQGSGMITLLPEIQPGPTGTEIEELVIADNVLWASAFRLDVGTELFRLDLEPWLVDPATILFTDGFESGDVAAWSASVPGSP